jgi:hypothetical protein
MQGQFSADWVRHHSQLPTVYVSKEHREVRRQGTVDGLHGQWFPDLPEERDIDNSSADADDL